MADPRRGTRDEIEAALGPGQVEFVAALPSPLVAGRYDVEWTHEVVHSDREGHGAETVSAHEGEPLFEGFRVSAPQLRLDPTALVGAWPQDGAVGPFAATLPLLVLRQPALPWERRIDAGTTVEPWLALAVVTDAELGAGRATVGTVSKDELLAGPGPALSLADLDDEEAARAIDVLTLDRELADEVLPTRPDLPLTAHVRSVRPARALGDGPADPVGWYAVVVGGRFPREGANTVFLVSLEGQAAALARTPEQIRLVVLHRWQFVSRASPSAADLESILRALDVGALTTPARALAGTGHVPLPLAGRSGTRSFALYRGPLRAGPVAPRSAAVPEDGDGLLRFDTRTGIADVGHAAAWQLGRLLAMQTDGLIGALRAWRSRSHARSLASLGQDPAAILESSLPHLRAGLAARLRREVRAPVGSIRSARQLPREAPPVEPVPEAVRTALARWSELRDVPLAYLVPDTRMLPEESLRLFWLDREWLRSLMYGALSAGGYTGGDEAHDRAELPMLLDRIAGTLPSPSTVGLLLRSRRLAPWPALRIDGTRAGAAIDVRRHEQLADDVRLVLFARPVDRISIRQPPESLHYGFEVRDGVPVRPVEGGHVAVALRATGSVDWAALAREVGAADETTRAAVLARALVARAPGLVLPIGEVP